MRQRVNIISINYNSGEDMLQCIFSLRKAAYQSFQHFIIDNNSTDNSLETIQTGCEKQGLGVTRLTAEEFSAKSSETKSDIVLVANPENNGFAAGNNIGLRFLLKNRPDELVWLLNPDVAIEPNVLHDLVALHGNRKKLILGNLIHYYSNRDKVMYCGGFKVNKWSHGITNIVSEKNIDQIDAITGASFFTQMDTFADLGLFPENYFLYWEETDFCTVAKKNHYRFEVNLKSKIYDKVGASSDSSFTREYLYVLNGLRYYRKFYPVRLPIIMLTSVAKFVKAIFFASKIKQRAVFFGHIDFIKDCFGKQPNVLQRIKEQ